MLFTNAARGMLSTCAAIVGWPTQLTIHVAAAFTLVVISASTPVFIALIVPLGALYLWIQKYYLRTSRELKRLDSVSRSPIYAHFQESLSGISTIRAYRQAKRFAMENEWRVDANLRVCCYPVNG